MHFIENPNLPELPAALVLADGRIGRETEMELKKAGAHALKLPPNPGLYQAVCCHPDMVLHHVGGDLIVHAPGTDRQLLSQLASYGFRLLQGDAVLSPEYPYDIAYNAARVGTWYFHNLKHTDRILAEQLKKAGAEPVHVEQGYAKCSILPLEGNSIVTTDVGVARAAEKKGLEFLLLEREHSILLPGLDYGFIGGACGMLAEKVCCINGDPELLDNGTKFISHLLSKQIRIKKLKEGPVTDIGSILPLMISVHGNELPISTYNI